MTTSLKEPLKYSGSLDHLEFLRLLPSLVSPIVASELINIDFLPGLAGREYPKTQIKDILNAPNAEQMIRDLAIIISQRGVVFFRTQELDIASQKRFTNLLGKLGGRPADHDLHKHPLFYSPLNSAMDEKGGTDPEIYVISSETQAKLYPKEDMKRTYNDAAEQWHSDCLFETCPADYSCLKLHETPKTGGDTMWASAYEVYDRMSPPWQKFMESLECVCAQPIFKKTGLYKAERSNCPIMEPRGSPLNVGDTFAPVHPMVRSNPVTGWKAIVGFGLHFTEIKDVSPYENQMIKDYVMRLVTRNHDLQARIKWTPNDVAIWDNRSVFHSATPDLMLAGGRRTGNRASSVGEKPYLDQNAKSRREALREGAEKK
ncbi:taurine catabolism dioxygenase [Atractiella rhizophila]|nr:taurine catabolism dioxygenase [Atractiella rhizophila]